MCAFEFAATYNGVEVESPGETSMVGEELKVDFMSSV